MLLLVAKPIYFLTCSSSGGIEVHFIYGKYPTRKKKNITSIIEFQPVFRHVHVCSSSGSIHRQSAVLSS